MILFSTSDCLYSLPSLNVERWRQRRSSRLGVWRWRDIPGVISRVARPTLIKDEQHLREPRTVRDSEALWVCEYGLFRPFHSFSTSWGTFGEIPFMHRESGQAPLIIIHEFLLRAGLYYAHFHLLPLRIASLLPPSRIPILPDLERLH